MKTYSFWFHYNKPQSRKNGKPILTVHYKGQCIFVEDLIINVPTHLRIRKQQPHAVISGKCSSFIVVNNKGVIS